MATAAAGDGSTLEPISIWCDSRFGLIREIGRSVRQSIRLSSSCRFIALLSAWIAVAVPALLVVSGLLPCARHTVANASRAHFGLAMWPSTVYISPQRRPDDSDTTAYPITAQQSNLTTKPDRCRRLTRGGRSPESVVRGLRSTANYICGITVANADIGCELMLLLLLLLYDFVSSATINQSIIYLYQTSGSYQKKEEEKKKNR